MDQKNKRALKAKRSGIAWVPIIGWFASMTFSTSLFAGGALWFANTHRTQILNQTLAEFTAPYPVTVGDFDYDRRGNFILGSVNYRDPTDPSTYFKLAKAGWEWDTRSLVASQYGKVELDAPEIRIGPKAFASWISPVTQPDPDPGAPQSVNTLALSLQGIGIRAGTFHFEADGFPTVEFEFEYVGDEFSLSEGHLSAAKQRLEIRNFAAVFDDGNSFPSSVSFGLGVIEFRADGDPGHLEISSLIVDGLSARITPSILALLPGEAQPTAGPATLTSPLPISILSLDRIRVADAEIALSGFADASFPLPEFDSGVDLDVSGFAVDLKNGSFSIGKQTLNLNEFALGLESSPGHVRAETIAIVVNTLTSAGASFESVTAKGTDIHLTGDLLSRLVALGETGAPAESGVANDTTEKTDPVPEFAFDTIEIQDARFSASDIPGIPNLTFHLSTTLPAWRIGGPAGLTLPDLTQTVTLSKIRVGGGADTEDARPLALVDEIGLTLNPAEFEKSQLVDRLYVKSPHFHLSPENVHPFLFSTPPDPARSNAQPPTNPGDQDDQPPAWEGTVITDFSISDGRLKIDEKTLAAVPKVALEFSARTESADGIPTYIIPLSNIATTLQSFQNAPFQTTRALTLTINTKDLWEDQTITEVDVDGMSGVMAQDLLDAIWAMLEEPEPYRNGIDPEPADIPAPSPLPPPNPPPSPSNPSAPEPSPADAEPEKPKGKSPWKIGRVRVRNSSFTLRGVAPGIPPVTVDLKADLKGVPLTPDAFLGDLREHQVEIAKIRIPSFYNPAVSVAELENIWIDFTLDGIAKQRIERVVVGSPTIYVGEHLFWYVDYYRKFLAEAEATPPPTDGSDTAPTGEPTPAPPPENVPNPGADPTGTPDPATKEKEVPDGAADRGATPPAREGGWTVDRLQAHNGQLNVAPKGIVVPGFPHPFPFSCDTTLESGEFQSEFTIPNGTYELPDIKLKVSDLFGTVFFNLPIKTLNNNLTESFEAAHLRFHQLEAKDLHLSVTYDAYGIYAKFGGAMYGGYINGEFNIYLDAQYTWDAWVAGSDISTEPLTSALTPEYFQMDGPIDFTVIANGNASELYQADGKLEGKEPGKMKVQALNDAIDALPDDWTYYETTITEIGLETLRDFDYGSVTGSFRLFGREGKVKLDLQGPTGSRVFKVNIHDHRKLALDPDLLNITKPDPKPDADDPDPEPDADPPQPEADPEP